MPKKKVNIAVKTNTELSQVNQSEPRKKLKDLPKGTTLSGVRDPIESVLLKSNNNISNDEDNIFSQYNNDKIRGFTRMKEKFPNFLSEFRERFDEFKAMENDPNFKGV